MVEVRRSEKTCECKGFTSEQGSERERKLRTYRERQAFQSRSRYQGYKPRSQQKRQSKWLYATVSAIYHMQHQLHQTFAILRFGLEVLRPIG